MQDEGALGVEDVHGRSEGIRVVGLSRLEALGLVAEVAEEWMVRPSAEEAPKVKGSGAGLAGIRRGSMMSGEVSRAAVMAEATSMRETATTTAAASASATATAAVSGTMRKVSVIVFRGDLGGIRDVCAHGLGGLVLLVLLWVGIAFGVGHGGDALVIMRLTGVHPTAVAAAMVVVVSTASVTAPRSSRTARTAKATGTSGATVEPRTPLKAGAVRAKRRGRRMRVTSRASGTPGTAKGNAARAKEWGSVVVNAAARALIRVQGLNEVPEWHRCAVVLVWIHCKGHLLV